jgi:hypothetical protein
MPDLDKVKLLFGPYRRPRLRLGERVPCLYRDRLVVVHGWTDAPISWPLCRPVEGLGRPGILVEEELARAVRGESSLALMHWWRASASVVHCWRTALGVERFTPGSRRLQLMNAEAGADAQRGVPRPDVAERMRQAHRERDLVRYIRPCPCPGGGRPWTPEEDAQLGAMPDGQAERHHRWVREGRGLIDRIADKAAIAREVRAGWMTLPEAAAGEERRVRRWTKTKPNGCGTWR